MLLLLATAPARAQDAEQIEPVVVTATRTEQRLGETPASVTVLTREDISRTAAQSLDDLLRQVPGFSLFRRSSS
ncbi:MAG: TonB-dependent receptor plug domain-containing protein, partial [Candidatus Rokuibacteriota bacterium]